MMYVTFILSVVFVLGFVGFSSKPSPIFGGLVFIVSGGVGSGLIVSSGGSFLGVVMFLIYLGGMMVVFGYTTAMATEEYPESWVSNWVVLGSLFLGVLFEVLVVVWVLYEGKCYLPDRGLVYSFWGLEDWLVLGEEGVGVVREDYSGGYALYGPGCWLVTASGFVLFISIIIIMEVTRGR
nr:NADH dehydrogenase subunit 6 [Procavia capensis]